MAVVDGGFVGTITEEGPIGFDAEMLSLVATEFVGEPVEVRFVSSEFAQEASILGSAYWPAEGRLIILVEGLPYGTTLRTFCHEIGHHIAGHTERWYISRPLYRGEYHTSTKKLLDTVHEIHNLPGLSEALPVEVLEWYEGRYRQYEKEEGEANAWVNEHMKDVEDRIRHYFYLKLGKYIVKGTDDE